MTNVIAIVLAVFLVTFLSTVSANKFIDEYAPCPNCNASVFSDAELSCWRRFINRGPNCMIFRKKHPEGNIRLNSVTNCVIFAPRVQFYGSIIGSNGNDCIFVGRRTVINGIINTGRGDDVVQLSKYSRVTSDIDLGSGDDCLKGELAEVKDVDLGSGNDFMYFFSMKNKGSEILGGPGDDSIFIDNFIYFDNHREIREILGVSKRDLEIEEIDSTEEDQDLESHFSMTTTEKRDIGRYPSYVGDINSGPGSDCISFYIGDVGEIKGGGQDDCMMLEYANLQDVQGGGGNDWIYASQWSSYENNLGGLKGGSGDDNIISDGFFPLPPTQTGLIDGNGGTDTCCHLGNSQTRRCEIPGMMCGQMNRRPQNSI